MISDITKDRNADAVTHVLGIIANGGTPDEINIALREELNRAYDAGVASKAEESWRANHAAEDIRGRIATKARVFAALYIANAREAYMPDEIDAATYTKTMVDTLIANGALEEAENLVKAAAK